MRLLRLSRARTWRGGLDGHDALPRPALGDEGFTHLGPGFLFHLLLQLAAVRVLVRDVVKLCRRKGSHGWYERALLVCS